MYFFFFFFSFGSGFGEKGFFEIIIVNMYFSFSFSPFFFGSEFGLEEENNRFFEIILEIRIVYMYFSFFFLPFFFFILDLDLDLEGIFGGMR